MKKRIMTGLLACCLSLSLALPGFAAGIFNKKSGPDEARLNLAKWYTEVEKLD